ncbi:MAG: BON domain-containing protein [Gammaproteobacteria bacterium]
MKYVIPLFLVLLNAGCASWVAPLSHDAVDQDHRYRTTGSLIEDQAIERKANINLYRTLPEAPASRIVVVSWNSQVLLAGQVPSAEARKRVEIITREIRRVVHVHNELTVAEPASLAARASDAWITGWVKTRLLFTPGVPGRRVKVVTENGVIYLMGLLTREESEKAVNAVRNTRGAQKIVKIFEYISPDRTGTASTPAAEAG